MPQQRAARLRVILDQAADGGFNMGLDRALWECLERDLASGRSGGPVLRLYGWARPTLSLGRFQRGAESELTARARALGVDAVRRPTGGRALVHQHELTYALVAPSAGELETLAGSGLVVAEALQLAFAALGVELERARGEAVQRPGRRSACLGSAARYELTWRGRKLAASAQRRGRHAFLQHGSLLLRLPWQLTAELTGSDVREHAIGLEQVLGRELGPLELARQLRAGFATRLGLVAWDTGSEARELELARRLAPAMSLAPGSRAAVPS